MQPAKNLAFQYDRRGLTVKQLKVKNSGFHSDVPWCTLRAVQSPNAWLAVALARIVASIIQGVTEVTGAGRTACA